MIFSYPDIVNLFELNREKVNTIVIENKHLLSAIVEDIANQVDGLSQGSARILNESGENLSFSKFVEIVTTVVPFEINKKSLVSKIINAIEEEALKEDFYEDTMSLLANIEKFFNQVTLALDCNTFFSKVTASNIIKSIGVEIVDDYDSVAEKIIDYFELIREFDHDKIFFTVNFRCFVDDKETERFMKTVIDHDISLIMLESTAYDKVKYENRLVIDKDLCEF